MKICITGSSGLVGRVTVQYLKNAGFDVITYDLSDGQDILNYAQLKQASLGCTVIVHLAAVDEPTESQVGPQTTGSPEKIFAVNVQGTKNVLEAAKENAVPKVIVLSSVDVFGVFMGQGTADYLPLDDNHPVRPRGPYAESKVAAENLCQKFTEDTHITTICLRPPGIFTADTYRFIKAKRLENPDFEWSPYWEYGAFIDARDVADAILSSIKTPVSGHHRLIICADDISSADLDSFSLVQKIMPEVEWRGGEDYGFKSLLDSSEAKRVIGFKPIYTWRQKENKLPKKS